MIHILQYPVENALLSLESGRCRKNEASTLHNMQTRLELVKSIAIFVGQDVAVVWPNLGKLIRYKAQISCYKNLLSTHGGTW